MLYVVWTIHRIYVCRTLYSKYSIVDGVNLVSHQLGCVQTPLITLTKGEKKKKNQLHVADLEEIQNPRYRIINPKQTAPNRDIDKNDKK